MIDPSIDAAERFLRFRMSSLLLTALPLSAGTMFVFFYVAHEEPFFELEALQFALIVLLGGLLCVSWLLWCAALAVSIEKPRHVVVLLVSIPWALANLAVLAFCIHGYFGDLHEFARRREGLGSGSVYSSTRPTALLAASLVLRAA